MLKGPSPVAAAIGTAALFAACPAQAAPTATFRTETRVNGSALPRAAVSGSAVASAAGTEYNVTFAGTNVSGAETVVSSTWQTTVRLSGQWCVGRFDVTLKNHTLVAQRSSVLFSMRTRGHAARTWSRWAPVWGEAVREASPDVEVWSSMRETCVIENDNGYRGKLHVEIRLAAQLVGTRRMSLDAHISLAE